MRVRLLTDGASFGPDALRASRASLRYCAAAPLRRSDTLYASVLTVAGSSILQRKPSAAKSRLTLPPNS